MFPNEAEAASLSTIEDIRLWYGIQDEPWLTFHAQIGQPDARILAALPPEALVENSMLTRVGASAASLTPAQAVTIGLIWRLARRLAWKRGGGNWDSWKDEDPWSRAPASTTSTTTVVASPALKERGIKMSSVIDQGDPENLATADWWYQRVATRGGGLHGGAGPGG